MHILYILTNCSCYCVIFQIQFNKWIHKYQNCCRYGECLWEAPRSKYRHFARTCPSPTTHPTTNWYVWWKLCSASLSFNATTEQNNTQTRRALRTSVFPFPFSGVFFFVGRKFVFIARCTILSRSKPVDGFRVESTSRRSSAARRISYDIVILFYFERASDATFIIACKVFL